MREPKNGTTDPPLLTASPPKLSGRPIQNAFARSNRRRSRVCSSVEDREGSLYVKNISRSRSTMTLPWWFPLPDAVVARLSEFFTRQLVTTGMKKVNEQIEKQYLEWAKSSVTA
eukprot:196377-Amphidinium_carterae.1